KSTLPFLWLQLDRSSGMKEPIPEQGLLNFWNERQNLFALIDREGKKDASDKIPNFADGRFGVHQ
ncbi:hypothetical protein, partial [Allobaculum mucilyticum]|uniref:hypothetical protein n=1 Tax=Allobaculum mucilyticum TaxID=2834459 RepID=UPI001E2CAECA